MLINVNVVNAMWKRRGADRSLCAWHRYYTVVAERFGYV